MRNELPEYFIVPVVIPVFFGWEVNSAVAIVAGRQLAQLVAERLERHLKHVLDDSEIHVLAETIYDYDEDHVDEIRDRISRYAEECEHLTEDAILEDKTLLAHSAAMRIQASILAEMKASLPSSQSSTPSPSTIDDLRSARWFTDATAPAGLYADLLKAARMDERLRDCEKIGARWFYSAAEVSQVWPQYRNRIMAKIATESETGGNQG